MLKTFANAWKIEDLRKKLIFTFWMIVVFRLGNVLPLPFVNVAIVREIYNGSAGSLLNLLNQVTGGGLDSLSVFALGVGPYITSSIVVQLLTFALPSLEELSKQGDQGRKKIQKITKYLALVLAFLQAYGIVVGIFNTAIASGEGFLPKLIVIIALVAGTQFVVWIGELITEKGIGNGVSMIIFLGIISRLPDTVISWTRGILGGVPGYQWWAALVLLLITLVSIVFVILLTEGERRIPVQYAKRVVGRKMYGGSSTHIPIKVNMSGVMPVIFASSLLALPQTLALIFNGISDFVQKYFIPTTTLGTIIFVIVQSALVIMFAYFYNSIQFNPYEYSKNLQQNGGFIPGIRPGKPTTEYLGKIVNRITLIGAIGLGIIAAVPRLFGHFMNASLVFGGTSIIIAVGVIVETTKQLEAMMQMRHYKGFLNK